MRNELRVIKPSSNEHISNPEENNLINQLVERDNMVTAYDRVISNKGSAGIDDISVTDLKRYLHDNWSIIKEQLLEGEYHPDAVKRVEIPKPNGGVRKLGIPTVIDRLIQQSLHQTLNPIFDPTFSDSSFGFREGKQAIHAVSQARFYQAKGKRWVVDIDLEKFFDKVDHDLLMGIIMKKVKDKNILKLIRRYLQADIIDKGNRINSREGTPQGSPLSPLLSNIMLDLLDKELEKRGHSFCRYADDCNIYVNSKKAGERVFRSICNFIETKLKLKVNRDKSAVDRPWKRKFLGYSFSYHLKSKLRVAKESIKRFKQNLKREFKIGRGRNLYFFINDRLNPKIRGWINYFIHAEEKSFTQDLDGWIRRRLRLILWRQWKRPRTRYKKLMKLGLIESTARKSAFNGRNPWWNSGQSHMNRALPKRYFNSLNLVSLVDKIYQFNRY